MSLDGKTVLVTGGSRGIGRAVALVCAGAGARVAVNYRADGEAAFDVVRCIQEGGSEAMAFQADVRRLDEVRAMADAVTERFGGIDVLVNNAGILRDNLVTFMSPEEWADVLDVDLTAAFYCIKVIGRQMVKRKSGRIVNMASDAGLLGDVMRANYAAAKAGLVGLTKTVAREFAASGVTVNAVSPGVIETDMTAGLAVSRRQRQQARVPQGRFGRPDEVAQAVLFLASADADYITGQVICVDGGLSISAG